MSATTLTAEMTPEEALGVLLDEHHKLADLVVALGELLVEVQEGTAPGLHAPRFREARDSMLVRSMDARDAALLVLAEALPE